MKRLGLLLLLPGVVATSVATTINWPDALKGVAAGEQIWLNQISDLAAAADVNQAVKLEDALSLALAANPPGALDALSVIDAHKWPYMIGTDIVCGVPVEKPSAIVEDFYQRTRLALLSTDKGASCLWFLEATYEEWKADKAHQVK
ncbi:hypothetical protein HQN64_09825 [Enterobacteriaceae bacterium BIT-l23]|uniref:hypothetical protein n=1 Tax=Jejubacter sp. L23 TaxID=3092086 RepID=UPI001585B7E7|nr:hypothetical protein [Enterobacteriaceae bacterium BIT-l23]